MWLKSFMDFSFTSAKNPESKHELPSTSRIGYFSKSLALSQHFWMLLRNPTGISRNLCDADIHHFTTAASTKAVHSTFAENVSANAGIQDCPQPIIG